MKQERQRKIIARACGWTQSSLGTWYPPGSSQSCPHGIPDYLNSLDAMHEAERALPDKNHYLRELQVVTIDWDKDPDDDRWLDRMTFATAAQRAEAFLRTLGLWEETP